MGCCWHHCGPHWGPYQNAYGRDTEMYLSRRRRSSRDYEEDLRDYLERLEGEIAAARREIEILTGRGDNSE